MKAALSNGKLKEQDVMVISDMSKKVLDHLTINHSAVKKEVMHNMFGTVLDYPTKTAYKLGTARQLVRSVQNIMDKCHFSLQDACDSCGSTVDEYEEAKKLIDKELNNSY